MRPTSVARLLAAPVALGLSLVLAPAVPVVPTAAEPAAEPAAAVKASAPQPKYEEYVALGDSWTADVVILNTDGFPATDHAPIDCAQSQRNYPKLVAKALGVTTFRDASCGSATTDDFANPQSGLPLGGTNPPQFDRLTKTTDLVTVGIGGNDAGIASAGINCLNVLPFANPLPTDQLTLPELPIPFIGGSLPLGGCKKKYTKNGVDELARNIRESQPKLVRALKTIRRLSPKARVLLVDYMSVIPDHGCYPLVPATDEDMKYIKAKFDQLNAMLARAARKGGAELVRTHRLTVGHDLCQGPRVRYAETLGVSVNDIAVGVPAHPNAAGARAQAASVLRYLSLRAG
jgi:hypothetical protein